jgi:hypothetical protein
LAVLHAGYNLGLMWTGITIIGEKLQKSLFVCLSIHCFTSRSRMFHLYGDVTIADEGLKFRPVLGAKGL